MPVGPLLQLVDLPLRRLQFPPQFIDHTLLFTNQRPQLVNRELGFVNILVDFIAVHAGFVTARPPMTQYQSIG